jgi:hypothetical protein
MKAAIKKAIKDYKEWRSFHVPILQALRLTLKFNVRLK